MKKGKEVAIIPGILERGEVEKRTGLGDCVLGHGLRGHFLLCFFLHLIQLSFGSTLFFKEIYSFFQISQILAK